LFPTLTFFLRHIPKKQHNWFLIFFNNELCILSYKMWESDFFSVSGHWETLSSFTWDSLKKIKIQIFTFSQFFWEKEWKWKYVSFSHIIFKTTHLSFEKQLKKWEIILRQKILKRHFGFVSISLIVHQMKPGFYFSIFISHNLLVDHWIFQKYLKLWCFVFFEISLHNFSLWWLRDLLEL
jgi:hypothetical protein